ncbi:MAG: PD-(D/E)XK nuclease family protein [Firmicutes bacterium]|nr:PD-(D/E)XK nuclease family protein [Bacillota bacterium]
MVNYLLTTSYEKHRFLISEEQNEKLEQRKFLSISELEKMLYGSYQDNYLFYMLKKGYLPSVATKLKPILWQVTEKEKELWELRQDLIQNHIMIPSTYLKEQLKKGKVTILHESNFLCDHRLLEDLKKEQISVVQVNDMELVDTLVPCTTFDTVREELCDVASQIVKLVQDGIRFNRIHILNASSEYQSYCTQVLELYQIPYTINKQFSIYSFPIIQELLEQMKDSHLPIREIETVIEKTIPMKEGDKKALELFADLVAQYIHEDGKVRELYSILKFESQKTKIEMEVYENAVTIESELYLGNIDDYYFIVGCNQESIPNIKLDIEYVRDREKEVMNIETSIQKNKREEARLLYLFSHLKHLYLSFAETSSFSNYTISPIIQKLNQIRPVCIKKDEYHYENNSYNRYLLAASLDTYLKYHEKTKDYEMLCHRVFIEDYKSYQNQYQTINENELPQYLNGELTLSYSSLDTYFHCPFRFYLKHILKVKEKIKGNATMIGTLFHDILSKVYETENIEQLITEKINEVKNNQELSKKELFYLEKYQYELMKICTHILHELDRTEFQKATLEETFTLEQIGTLHIKLIGVIDKILTLELNGEVYAIVIDYKTGNTKVDLNRVAYGLDMQLLMYLYFLKHTEKLNHPKIAGFFLQHILPNVMVYNEKKTYEEMRSDFYQLDGYVKDSTSLLYHIDNQYMEKGMIKGIRVKKDGTFYQGAKVFDDALLETLLNMVEEHLEKAIHQIETCQFEIAPIRIGYEKVSEITGCAYCSYRDICFRKIENIRQVKEYKSLEFIGGEKDEDKTN